MFCGYLLISAVYTWPLLPQLAKQIASDPYDPILGATMLEWNATTLPFSEHWWSPPFFYPHHDVGAFTENFVGISALASPIYWLTGDPIKTYNIVLFLTWPLAGEMAPGMPMPIRSAVPTSASRSATRPATALSVAS